jgi:hypothetical protein
MRQEPTVFKTLDLPAGALMPFASVPGERVRILCGRVWLTEEGSPHDVFLGSGEEMALGTLGLAVVEALAPARIQLLQPAEMSSAMVNAAQRMMRRLIVWWTRQFRHPAAVHACEF